VSSVRGLFREWLAWAAAIRRMSSAARTGKPSHLYDPYFLEKALSDDACGHAAAVWDLLRFAVRPLAFLGVVLRFAIHWHEHSEWYSQMAVVIGCIAFGLVETRAGVRDHGSLAKKERPNKWISVQVTLEMLSVALLYVLSGRADSDLYLLWLLPLMMATEFLPVKSLLRILAVLIALLAACAFAAEYLALPSHKLGWSAIVSSVILIRALFLLVATVPTLYLLRDVRAYQWVWAALMGAMPEGLSIVTPDHVVRWVNKVQKERFADRELIGQKCHYAYKRRREPCEPCPMELALEHQRVWEEVTKSPEYIAPDDTVPDEAEWRRFDTLCAPFHYRDEPAVLECVKDTTCREVMLEVSTRLQTARHEDEILHIACEAARGLGYRRCRVFALVENGQALQGRHALGMDDVEFIGKTHRVADDARARETLASNKPIIFPGDPQDALAGSLKKDSTLPWIEIPLKLGNHSFGIMCVDNTGHPLAGRAAMAEETAADAQGRHSDQVLVLHNIGVAVSLALSRTRSRSEIVAFISPFVHMVVDMLAYARSAIDELSDLASQEADVRDVYDRGDRVLGWLHEYGTSLLDWCKIWSRTEISLHPRDADPTVLVKETLEFCQFMTELYERDVHIKLEGESFQAMVDPRIVQQIVFVVLTNAFHVVGCDPDGGSAKVIVTVLQETGRGIRIEIRDSGPGVNPSNSNRIFEEGFRDGRYQGSGMGLALAKSLAQKHGGDVTLEKSITGIGTEFAITLSEIRPEANST